jgi:N-acyl-D-amino-acid deacylase
VDGDTVNQNQSHCFDVILRGGTVVDGTGATPFAADVGILGEHIAAIGDLREAEAHCVLEVAGLCVAPGFIDIHTHSDISLLYNPQQTSALVQGITTQVVGNCGIAMGLITDEPVFAYERRWLAPYGIRVTWQGRLARFHERVLETGTATNIIPQVAHGTLRKRVMGMERRPPTSDELRRMQALIEQAVEDGVWGFSTGLEYAPGSYAQTDEIIALAKTAARFGLFYSTHLRDEADHLLEAVQEALRIGEEAGIPVQLSHHKADGERNWGLVQRTLQMVEEARARGMDVMLDQYPYDAYLTSLLTGILPDWATEGGPDAIVTRLQSSGIREQIKAEILTLHPDWEHETHWHRVVIAVARNNRDLQGHSIAQIARERGCHPLDCALDILIEEHTFVSAARFTPQRAGRADRVAPSIDHDWFGCHRHRAARQDVRRPGASPNLRNLPARAWTVYPRIAPSYSTGGGVQDDRLACAAVGVTRPRRAARGSCGRHHRIPSPHRRRPRHL